MSNRSVQEGELADNIPLSLIHGNELLDTGHDIILIFGLGSKHGKVTTEVINER